LNWTVSVVGIVVVGRNELDLRGQVTHTDYFKRFHFRERLVLVLPFEAGVIAAFFLHERGSRLEGVEIEMEWKSILRLASEVAISKDLGGVDSMFGGVEAGVDLVANDALGERLVSERGDGWRRSGRGFWRDCARRLRAGRGEKEQYEPMDGEIPWHVWVRLGKG
jgi:hypothetical protein